MYIDFDNTGENLRLITIEEMVNNSGGNSSINSTRSRYVGNTNGRDGHIFIYFISLLAKFITKVQILILNMWKKRECFKLLLLLLVLLLLRCACHFHIHSQMYSTIFSLLIITYFFFSLLNSSFYAVIE